MKNFLLAARPKTLLAGILPPIVTYAYFHAVTQNHAVSWVVLCVAGALAIQLATNFFNDVIDHKKGADKVRVGPTRVSAAGLVDLKTVELWAWGSVAAAAVIGIPIILRGGWPFILLGLISLYLTFGYTGGKVSLAYRGLGELFVFLFFGLFSVLGSFYLYGKFLNAGAVVLAGIFGLLTTTLICMNNLRDRKTDKEVGKRTLATRWSESSYRRFTVFTAIFPYVLTLYFISFPALPVLILGLIPGVAVVRSALKNEGSELNQGLKLSGIHLLIYSILLSGVFLYGHPV